MDPLLDKKKAPNDQNYRQKTEQKSHPKKSQESCKTLKP